MTNYETALSHERTHLKVAQILSNPTYQTKDRHFLFIDLFSENEHWWGKFNFKPGLLNTPQIEGYELNPETLVTLAGLYYDLAIEPEEDVWSSWKDDVEEFIWGPFIEMYSNNSTDAEFVMEAFGIDWDEMEIEMDLEEIKLYLLCTESLCNQEVELWDTPVYIN